MIIFKTKKKQQEELDKTVLQRIKWRFLKYWKIIISRYEYKSFSTTEIKLRQSIERLRDRWDLILNEVIYRWFKKNWTKSYASSKVNVYDVSEKIKEIINSSMRYIKDYSSKIIEANKKINITKLLNSLGIKTKDNKIITVQWYTGDTPYEQYISYCNKKKVITDWSGWKSYNPYNYCKDVLNISLVKINKLFNII